MKALILAGGLGSRLRPLTYTRPKHLLPIVNRPHIEHVFDLLERHGVTDVVLLTSYLAEAFAGAANEAAARGLKVEVTHEPEPLGTAGAIKNAQALLSEETFLVFNGDILTDVDLTSLVEWHKAKAATATILLTPVEDPSVFGVVPTDDEGRVTAFIEKPPPGQAPSNEINAGIYVLEPAVLDYIPAGEVWSAERALFPALVEDEAGVFARSTDAYWMDIGTPEKYLAANLDALAGRYRCAAVPEPGAEAVVGKEESRVARDAEVSLSCLGRGSTIGEGAIVTRSVLLPGAIVGAGATVDRSILGEGTKVEPGVEVSGRTFADGELVGSSI